MTFSPSSPPPGYVRSTPPRLSWVTVPLIVMLVFQVLGILFLPLLLPLFSSLMNMPSAALNGVNTDTNLSVTDIRTIVAFFSAFIWVIEVVQVAFAVLYFLTLRAVQGGRSWGRIVAIILFILNLLSFPVGTVLGIFGLIGALDPEVTAYESR